MTGIAAGFTPNMLPGMSSLLGNTAGQIRKPDQTNSGLGAAGI
jgi:hypothetical protein